MKLSRTAVDSTGSFTSTGLSQHLTPPAQETVNALVCALTFVIGMQSIRTFIPLCTFYFYDVRNADPLVTGSLAFFVLGSGWVSPWIHRNLPRIGLPALGVTLACCRLAEQLTREPGMDLLWSGLATALFMIALPLRYLCIRAGPSRPSGSVLIGVSYLAGSAIDLVIHLRLRSLDLSWQSGLPPLVFVAATCLSLAVLSIISRAPPASSARPAQADQRAGLPGAYTLFGFWLLLQVQIFGNPASLAAYSDFRWRQVFWIVAISLILQFGAVISVRRRVLPSGLQMLLAPSLGVLVILYLQGGLWSIAAQILGSILGGLFFLRVHYAVATAVASPFAQRFARLSCCCGPLIFTLLLFLYYAAFEYRLGFGSEHLIIASAAGLAIGGFAFVRQPPSSAFHLQPLLVLAVLAMLLNFLPLNSKSPIHSANLIGPTGSSDSTLKSTTPSGPEFRFMTYNVHQGFNTAGVLDPEAIAMQIQSSGATLVALQEVSRGWVVNGSTDLLEWLAHRLGMFAYFGATAGPLWGNALLSDLPLDKVRSHRLQPTNLPLQRGYLDGYFKAGEVSVRILATHLHHRKADSTVRMTQTKELLAAWNESSATIITGDLNADPESAAVNLVQSSGLRSAADLLDTNSRATILRQSGNRQIDYIWVTSDLHVENVDIPISAASDHLPVVASIRSLPPS